MNLTSQHWIFTSRNTLLSSVITQPPTFLPPASHVSNFQQIPHPYTFNTPTCAPLPSEVQNIDGTDYRYRLESFLNGVKARTV